jgi:recombination protein RecT
MSDTAKTPAPDNNVQQLPSKAAFKRLAECKTLGEAFQTKELKDLIAGAIPKHMEPDRMLRAFVQTAGRTPQLYQCDLRQTIGAFMSLTYLGLVPGTVLQHAHLIPFKKRKKVGNRWVDDGYDLQIVIGYQGYVELAFRSGFVRDIASGLVYPGDHFDFERGSKRFLIHKQSLDIDPSSMTPRAAYAIAKFTNDGEEFEVMPWPEIERIRNRSEAYKTALRVKEKAEADGQRPGTGWTAAPWVAHPGEMARKTAIRRLAKLLPKCPELQAGIGIEDAHDAGKKLDYGPVIDGTATPIDGIPEQPADDGDDGGPPDPGTAHTDRRPPPVDQGTTQQNPKARPARQQASTGGSQRVSPKPGPATTPTAKSPPPFEAVLISAWGEIGAETFTDPVEFARTLIGEYQRIGAHATDAANLIEHNADAIDQARAVPEAAQLLRALDEPPPAEDQGGDSGESDPGFDPDAVGEHGYTDETGEQSEYESGTADSPPPMTFAAIDVPKSNGKPSWPTWLSLLRDELATVDVLDLLAFTEAQRGRLAECPLAQRALAVQAITQRFVKADRTPPGWLADLIAMPTQRQKDEKWLADRLADLAAIDDTPAGRMHFDSLIRSTATRTVMARLRADDPELFARADAAFGKKHNELPAAPGEQR